MDREIDPSVRRKQFARRGFLLIAGLAIIAAGFIYAPRLLNPSLNRSRIRTATVDSGSMEATLSASGTVVPEFEQVISSPIDARVTRIFKRPGDEVKRGEPIIELDVSESVLGVEKINQQIALKQNQQDKIKLDLDNTLIELQSRWEIKNLEYKSARASAARSRTLAGQGLLSEEKLREAELQEEKTALELRQIEQAKRNAQQATKTQVAGLALEMSTLQKERVEAQRQLELGATRADRDGVLTWVVTEEGATVQKGAVLARLADLHSFRVDATISDIHANQLAAGIPVQVKISDEYLQGVISLIQPTIKDGIITARITLNDKASALLKSNLRVDVFIITNHKDKVLRIKKGPAINGEGTRDVFVIRGDTAVKTPVKIGIASFDSCEVVDGLLEGDEVIISDMTDYQHVKEVRLK